MFDKSDEEFYQGLSDTDLGYPSSEEEYKQRKKKQKKQTIKSVHRGLKKNNNLPETTKQQDKYNEDNRNDIAGYSMYNEGNDIGDINVNYSEQEDENNGDNIPPFSDEDSREIIKDRLTIENNNNNENNKKYNEKLIDINKSIKNLTRYIKFLSNDDDFIQTIHSSKIPDKSLYKDDIKIKTFKRDITNLNIYRKGMNIIINYLNKYFEDNGLKRLTPKNIDIKKEVVLSDKVSHRIIKFYNVIEGVGFNYSVLVDSKNITNKNIVLYRLTETNKEIFQEYIDRTEKGYIDENISLKELSRYNYKDLLERYITSELVYSMLRNSSNSLFLSGRYNHDTVEQRDMLIQKSKNINSILDINYKNYYKRNKTNVNKNNSNIDFEF